MISMMENQANKNTFRKMLLVNFKLSCEEVKEIMRGLENLKEELEKVAVRKKLVNQGLIGIIAIQRILDIYMTYKAREIAKERFKELNTLMERVIENKPLVYLINAGYIGGLEALNYVANKIGMNKVATAGLSISILIQSGVLLNNYSNLREISR